LSKSLVELHGGNFKIESVVGQGTTVIFTLPNRPPEKKVAQTENEVGNEISRLAQDIAEVLSQSEGEEGQQSVAPPPPTTSFVPHETSVPAPAQEQTHIPKAWVNPAA